jgi:micrococcal nuclease
VPAVDVASDPTQDTRDKYGRLLFYVWLPDGRLFQREMIAAGLAYEYTYDRAYQQQADFKAAQREAEQAKRGLWAPGACDGQAPVSRSSPAASTAKPAAPSPATAATQPLAQPGRGVPPANKDNCPPSHPIKGNRGAERIYHKPGSPSYAMTDPEECFASEADAVAAGYRAAR